MSTTTQVQWRRGNSAAISVFAGASGEIAVNTDISAIVVQDGNGTLGGWTGARIVDLNNAINNLSGVFSNNNFATVPNLTQTGIILLSDIQNTGQISYIYTSGVSGNLTQTGATLLNKILAVSGALQTEINNISGSSSGITNLPLGIVYQTGNQIITGGKIFIGSEGNSSISTYNRDLYDITGNLSLDWQDRIATGNWNFQSGNFNALQVQGVNVLTGAVSPTPYNLSGSYIFNTNAISGSGHQFILFPAPLGSNPYVLCSLNNTGGIENILVQTSGITSSGYWAQYSNTIDSSGYILTTLASISTQTGLATTVIINQGGGTATGSYYPLNSNPSGYITNSNLSGCYIFNTNATSGLNQQFINFPSSLGNNPYVVCQLNNTIGDENIIVQASGINSSGYWAQYLTTIDTTGYILTTLASTSTQTGLAVTIIMQVSGGTTGSFYPLNSNPSGYITSGQTGAFSFILGTNILSNGINNTIIGNNAGNGGIGLNNTAIGKNSLSINSGNLNTAVGSQSLSSNTIGTANTAVGGTAMSNNTIGGFNTAVGEDSLEFNITGSNNVSFGAGAMILPTGASNCTAIGASALGNSFSLGSNNIALGYQAGFAITTGNNNILIGNTGFSNDNNIIRIGSNQTTTYITGDIYTNNVFISGNQVITAGMTGGFFFNSGLITGAFYPLHTNPSGYITTGQTGSFGGGTTGSFYPLNSNPSGYITGTYVPSINYNTNINWSTANTFYTTLTGNTNFTFSNQKDGQTIVVSVSNSGLNNFSGIWPNGLKWPLHLIPTQSSGNFTDIYTFIDITGVIYGNVIQGF